ncbi:hypothetical protein QJS66_22865 [Kocuria rhizophila]|nr:hypothetical protein QJS66_22865 [Kocuria rhizophila]
MLLRDAETSWTSSSWWPRGPRLLYMWMIVQDSCGTGLLPVHAQSPDGGRGRCSTTACGSATDTPQLWHVPTTCCPCGLHWLCW